MDHLFTHSTEEEEMLEDCEVNEQHIVLWAQSDLLPRLLQVGGDVPAAHFCVASRRGVHTWKKRSPNVLFIYFFLSNHRRYTIH